MKNSELAKQAYALETIAMEAFNKCIPALIGKNYIYDHLELHKDGIEIIGNDLNCYGEYKSTYLSHNDLDNIDAFISRRLAENAEAERLKEEKKLSEIAKKKLEAEQNDLKTYLRLKKKYETIS
jgi:hypothetical protein